MYSYQSYDFKKDIDFHIDRNAPIYLDDKSDIFKVFLFKLKIFQLNDKIKNNHPMFNEEYFLFIMGNKVNVAKKMKGELNFDHIEIINGIKIIRKMKLMRLFKKL
jgi:hypothetical protein